MICTNHFPPHNLFHKKTETAIIMIVWDLSVAGSSPALRTNTWQGGVGELQAAKATILGSSSAGRATKNHKSCLGQKKLFDFIKKI